MTSRAQRRRATSPKGGRIGVIVRWTDDEECSSHEWSVLLACARARGFRSGCVAPSFRPTPPTGSNP